MTPEAQRLADVLTKMVNMLAEGLADQQAMPDDSWRPLRQQIITSIDRLASLIPAGGLAEEARDAARFRYILNNTSGQLMSETRDFIWSSDMPADEVRAAIDAALSAPTPQQEQPR